MKRHRLLIIKLLGMTKVRIFSMNGERNVTTCKDFAPCGKEATLGAKRTLRPVFTAALVLFLAVAVTIPLALSLAYAGRPEAARHVITYTTGKLVWDSATDINADGSAKLDLFSSKYDGTVISDNGDKLIAPGSEGTNIIRLKNSAAETIKYRAVLYEERNDSKLPVESTLAGSGMTDTSTYTLPKGAPDARVLKSVEGTVGGGRIQDFDVVWKWIYDESVPQDTVDTGYGNKASFAQADHVTMGFYIVIEDVDTGLSSDGIAEPIKPSLPMTGDSGYAKYLLLMLASMAGFCAILIFSRKAMRRDGESN